MMSFDYYLNRYLPAWYYLQKGEFVELVINIVIEISLLITFFIAVLQIEIWNYYDLLSSHPTMRLGEFIAGCLFMYIIVDLFSRKAWDNQQKIFKKSLKRYDKDVL